MTKPLIIFDWNGTLLDDTEASVHGANAVMAMFGKEPLSADIFRQHYQVPFVRFYEALGCPDIENNRAAMNKAFFSVHDALVAEVGLRDGAYDLLNALTNVQATSVVLSNYVVSEIDKQAHRFGVRHHFDTILANEDKHGGMIRDKKHRIIDYLAICDAQPSCSYIVGDSVEEVEIGRALGFTTIALTGGMSSLERMEAANPHHVAHSLHDMHAILQRDGVLP